MPASQRAVGHDWRATAGSRPVQREGVRLQQCYTGDRKQTSQAHSRRKQGLSVQLRLSQSLVVAVHDTAECVADLSDLWVVIGELTHSQVVSELAL